MIKTKESLRNINEADFPISGSTDEKLLFLATLKLGKSVK
jgi:hypothetical protein